MDLIIIIKFSNPEEAKTIAIGYDEKHFLPSCNRFLGYKFSGKDSDIVIISIF